MKADAKNIFWTTGAVISLLFVFASAAAAETWYVKRDRTALTKEASARSPKVATLKAGTPVQVLKKTSRFYKVRAQGKTGWVFKFKLTDKKPAKSGGGGGLDALLGDQKMAAAESSTGSSIRGLSPVSEKQAQTRGISESNIQAVKQMETFKVTPEELDAFLREGELREYFE